MSETNSGPVAPTPAPLVPDSAGQLRSSGVAYSDQWPGDLETQAVLTSIRDGGGSWRSVTVLSEIASTNTVGLALAAAGCTTGVVLVTDLQTAGRGRLDRSWEAPSGTSAMFTVVLRPGGDHAWGVLPLVAGVAICEALESVTGLRASLKWPNDVVISDQNAPSGRGGKVGGILAERDADSGAIVLGVGLNVDLAEPDLPIPAATSLTLAGVPRPPRAQLVGRALARIEHWYTAWEALGADTHSLDGFLADYRERCISIGSQLTVTRPGGDQLRGTALGVDSSGALLVDVDGSVEAVVAGDVTHAPIT